MYLYTTLFITYERSKKCFTLEKKSLHSCKNTYVKTNTNASTFTVISKIL